MWITWNEHGDQRTWDPTVLFVEARCASKKLKHIPTLDLGHTDRFDQEFGDLCGLGGLCG